VETAPVLQVFRAGDPVDREKEAFVPRDSVVGDLQGIRFANYMAGRGHRVQRLVSSRPGVRCEFSDSTDWEISQPGEG
jgi:hypothetical protein